MTSRTVERIRRDRRTGREEWEKGGKRKGRRGLRGESERYRIITLAFFLSHRSFSPSRRARIRLLILLRTSCVSLFNDCGTTIDITRREWTSNEPLTPSVCIDDGRSFHFQGYCRHFTAVTIEIEHNMLRTYIAGSVNLLLHLLQLNFMLFLFRLFFC